VELLVGIVILAVLLGLMIPSLTGARAQARSVACLSNLHQLGLAFELYAENHDGFLPSDQQAMMWDYLLRPYVPKQQSYQCPADIDQLGSDAGVSYGWRETFSVDYPVASLSGRRLATAMPRHLIFIFDAMPDWHGSDVLNAAALDQSVRPYELGEYETNMRLAVQ
jgi:competence protein ComGC